MERRSRCTANITIWLIERGGATLNEGLAPGNCVAAIFASVVGEKRRQRLLSDI